MPEITAEYEVPGVLRPFEGFIIECLAGTGKMKPAIAENGLFLSRLWIEGMDISPGNIGVLFPALDPVDAARPGVTR